VSGKATYEELKKRVEGLEAGLAVLVSSQKNPDDRLKKEIAGRKLAEDALRKSERRPRTLLGFAPYPAVVFTMEGRVSYVNPAFTEIFGWTFEELRGKNIPYVPPGLEAETSDNIKKLFHEKIILRHETKRLTKDGRILDVVMRAAVFSETPNEPAGELVILRDVTREKHSAMNNEAILRISMALPEYPDLEELLDYVSAEIKRLLDTEAGVVILLDEEKQELFFPGVAYDDTATQKRVKEMRFRMDQIDQVVAERVIKTGEPIIINDTSKIRKSYPVRDRKLGYQTRNFLQVPLKSNDRIIGALTAMNKKEGIFQQADVELLSMIAATVALSIENARFAEELKRAYREMSSLNRAKDKVFHHLSHELKTPVAVLYPSLNILAKKLQTLPEDTWKPTIERAKRNLDRIMEIHYQVEDIIRDRSSRTRDYIHMLLDQCADEVEALIAEKTGEGAGIERIRERIEEIFGLKSEQPEEISLQQFVEERLEQLKPQFSHRDVEVTGLIETVPSVCIPRDPLRKVVDGIIKNAVENTPDEGKIEVIVRQKEGGAELVARDYGVGIVESDQVRIFEGFFSTQDTMAYSSRRPFDFNAGGKGADLLRMKIFSERYNFKIHMISTRCGFIPKAKDVCPGRISKCHHCRDRKDCYVSGGTTFYVYFPA